MASVLMVNYEKCHRCRMCEAACSTTKEGATSPSFSRIEVVESGVQGRGIPIVCAQCESAPCRAICPVRAISRDEPLERVTVDYDTCIGCRMCVAVCPFGCMRFDRSNRRVFKCDLCDGEPTCVKFCAYEALAYVDDDEQSSRKRRTTGEQISEIMHRIAAAMASAD